MDWSLLSYRKPITASSFLTDYEPSKANDERIETWWSAQSGKKGEWIQIDLEREFSVNALHVNFADHNFKVFAPHPPVVYQFFIEGSLDGQKWISLVDEKGNQKDEPHRLFTLDQSVKVRYVRICNTKKLDGCFSISVYLVRMEVIHSPK